MHARVHTHAGEWQRYRISQVSDRLNLETLAVADGFVLDVVSQQLQQPSPAVFMTKFGGPSGIAGDTQIGSFIGCMRDVFVNGNALVPAALLASSVNVQLVCSRQPQVCARRTCGSMYARSVYRQRVFTERSLRGSVVGLSMRVPPTLLATDVSCRVARGDVWP
jgi:hypothetical protein